MLFNGGWGPENILLKNSSSFFFTFYIFSNQAASSDFAVTGRKMINYIGNKTFPIVIMSVFRTKLYMQHLRSLFWFLLTILSIFSFTVLPLISTGSQISAVASHNQIKISAYL